MILDDKYIKEQAHKPCFWSKEIGFDVVSFTHAMEQNYSNRVGSKINKLGKQLAEVTKQRDELLAALKLAVCQNSHDMLMTGEELRQCEAAIASRR